MGVFVLVVHDRAVDAAAICEALRSLFIVRESTDAFEALERLSGQPLACVVCVVGGGIRGDDFLKLVAHAAPDQLARLVIVDDGAEAPDYVRGTGASHLPSADPKELLTVVSALSARR